MPGVAQSREERDGHRPTARNRGRGPVLRLSRDAGARTPLTRGHQTNVVSGATMPRIRSGKEYAASSHPRKFARRHGSLPGSLPGGQRVRAGPERRAAAMTRSGRSCWAGFVTLAVLVSGLGAVVAQPVAGAAKRTTKKHKTVEVTSTFRRVIQPADPTNPPTTPPAILPTLTCVRRVGRQQETVFGYDNQGNWSYDAASYNYILDGPERIADLGQPGQFLPGSHPSLFAVRTTRRATWVLEVPSMAEEQAFIPQPTPPRWQVSIKARHRGCAADVPQHFASVGSARFTATSYPDFPVPVDVARDQTGHITGYAVAAPGLQSQSACSPGGVPLEPRVVYGERGDNLVPLSPEQIIADNNGEIYTEVSTRQVADVHVNAGYVSFIFDIYGRCQFGTAVVEASQPLWIFTDYPPAQVSFFIANVNGVDEIDHFEVSPGGVRFR